MTSSVSTTRSVNTVPFFDRQRRQLHRTRPRRAAIHLWYGCNRVEMARGQMHRQQALEALSLRRIRVLFFSGKTSSRQRGKETQRVVDGERKKKRYKAMVLLARTKRNSRRLAQLPSLCAQKKEPDSLAAPPPASQPEELRGKSSQTQTFCCAAHPLACQAKADLLLPLSSVPKLGPQPIAIAIAAFAFAPSRR